MQQIFMFIQLFQALSKHDAHLAGGKGASLGEMTQAGIPVPPGFVVLRTAFDRFLEEADLVAEVEAILGKVNYEDIVSVDCASQAIRDLIHDAYFSEDLEEEIFSAFDELGAEFVAVRSSATAEDSSTASWAGELESYLNTTRDNLLGNVKKCWASLFTSRAIVYRNEKGMRNTHVSVAVVIQKMVQSEISGVTFTVHPVTRDTNQMILEACWGLGEYIVGGVVTPDSYVVDKKDGTILDTYVADQGRMLIRGKGGSEDVPVSVEKVSMQKLNGVQIRELADICMNIERHYRFPCDIEWCMEGGVFYVVQSRPITTL